MKPFAIAKALDMGIVTPMTTIQTAPGKLTIGDRTIGDIHDYGLLTVAEIVARSSNIGTVKIPKWLRAHCGKDILPYKFPGNKAVGDIVDLLEDDASKQRKTELPQDRGWLPNSQVLIHGNTPPSCRTDYL